MKNREAVRRTEFIPAIVRSPSAARKTTRTAGAIAFDSTGGPHPFGFFVWEVVKAHVASSPKYPETLHYRGDGVFMVSGKSIGLRRKFQRKNL
jgi:hypothetical protein